jgi:hypothetical protein
MSVYPRNKMKPPLSLMLEYLALGMVSEDSLIKSGYDLTNYRENKRELLAKN